MPMARTEIGDQIDDQINKFVRDEGLKAPAIKPRQITSNLRNQFDTDTTLQNVVIFYKGANIDNHEYKDPFAGSGAFSKPGPPAAPPFRSRPSTETRAATSVLSRAFPLHLPHPRAFRLLRRPQQVKVTKTRARPRPRFRQKRGKARGLQ